MPFRIETASHVSDFVQLMRDFLTAHTELTAVLGRPASEQWNFEAIRGLVGDDDRSVLYRLKEKSHRLFRSDAFSSPTVRREALFDLAVGSLFHEAMNLRESLYQREVYAPRVDSLRAAAGAAGGGDESAELFREFDRILDRSSHRLNEFASEVRDLLIRTRDQFRLLLVERAGEREVTRCLLNRRAEVDATFDEGFEGLLGAMHGEYSIGLIQAAHALVESAYFGEAIKTLHEAARSTSTPRSEIDHLERYAEGMQAFLDGDYPASLACLEAWAGLGGNTRYPILALRARLALSRIGRLVDEDSTGEALIDQAKQIQLQLETAST